MFQEDCTDKIQHEGKALLYMHFHMGVSSCRSQEHAPKGKGHAQGKAMPRKSHAQQKDKIPVKLVQVDIYIYTYMLLTIYIYVEIYMLIYSQVASRLLQCQMQSMVLWAMGLQRTALG